MRIALVSEHASPLAHLGGPDAGGQNVYVAALARQLARRGHHVVVFTRRDSLSQRTRVAVDGYYVHHLTAGPVAPIPKDGLLVHMPEFADRLFDRLWREHFDLVHSHFWMSGIASVAAAHPLNIPVVHTFHALGSVKRRHQGAADTSPGHRVALERRLCRQVDHVIATCADEVEELRRLGLRPDCATIVPCGVDTDLFKPQSPPPKTRSLLVIGRLVRRKGVDDVITALADVPDATLTIAGGPDADALDADPETMRLRRLARTLHVTDRVRFLGSVQRNEVPRLMRESTLVVCAPWYEPFGIVPVEAMASGRPVVGTAVGGLLDTIDDGETGDLVPPQSPDQLAQALRRLLDDQPRQVAYGLAGRRKAVRGYRWDQVADSIESVYAELLGSTRTSIPVGSEA